MFDIKVSKQKNTKYYWQTKRRPKQENVYTIHFKDSML